MGSRCRGKGKAQNKLKTNWMKSTALGRAGNDKREIFLTIKLAAFILPISACIGAGRPKCLPVMQVHNPNAAESLVRPCGINTQEKQQSL
jgi:hypothetical protein